MIPTILKSEVTGNLTQYSIRINKRHTKNVLVNLKIINVNKRKKTYLEKYLIN